MKNALEIIEKDCGRHKVPVILPGKKGPKDYFLIMIDAKTSLLEDLKITYGDAVTRLHVRMAENLSWVAETDNTYGVLIDNEMRMVFAFNRAFADYNKKTKEIDYKDIDDLLIEKIKPSTVSIPPRRPSGGSMGVLRYAIQENPAGE